MIAEIQIWTAFHRTIRQDPLGRFHRPPYYRFRTAYLIGRALAPIRLTLNDIVVVPVADLCMSDRLLLFRCYNFGQIRASVVVSARLGANQGEL